MGNVKRGTIVEIHKNQNIGFVVEDKTGIKWLFFLDTISKSQKENVKPGVDITFVNDRTYHQELFVCTQVRTIHQALDKAV